MATFAIRTAEGAIVGLIRAQDDAPPPVVTGDPGYSATSVDVADEAIAMSGADAEVQIRETFEALRTRYGDIDSG
jgi:hypothetical protein